VHKLLARQLRKCFGASGAVPPELLPFIALVDATYREADDDRTFIEHSMETVSTELGARNQRAVEAVAMLEAIIESTTDGVLVVDREARIVRANEKFAELWRIPTRVLDTRDDRSVLAFVLDQVENPKDFLAKVEQLYANPEDGSFDTIRFRDQRVFERYSMPLRVGGGTTGRVWSYRDVTHRLELENQLRQSQKMEAIGLLAGGVAHDFNNMLTVISGHLEFLTADPSLSASHREDLREMQVATSRAVNLTRQLLTFGRKRLVRPVVLDLNDVVAEVSPILARLIGEDVMLDTILAPQEASVVVDRGQLEQILVNLVVNARDAMPNGGRVTLSVSNAVLDDEGRAGARGGLLGRHAVLSVRDSGHGIAAGELARIFEPFYTTKEVGKGTGLGLSTVYGIVRQAQGFIEVHSTVGVGTTFEVFLPSACPQAEVVANPHPAPLRVSADTEASKAATILVIEDEEAVARVLRRTLEEAGYELLLARTGREALTMMLANGGRIDLVISDVVMPEMSGPQFAQHLRIDRPEVPVIYISGYTDDMTVRAGLVHSGAVLLEKPFTSEDLLRAVAAALSPPGNNSDGTSPRAASVGVVGAT